MTYYIKLQSGPECFYQGATAERVIFVSHASLAAGYHSPPHQLLSTCRKSWPDAEIVEVQPEPEPKFRSAMRMQRDQLRDELKRAWDAIPPGIASRHDSVSAAVAKLAYAYNDKQDVSDNYLAARRALPEEFRGYYALPDSVAKLAKAYEEAKAEIAKLKQLAKPTRRRVSGAGLSSWSVNDFDRPGNAVFTDPGGETHSARRLHECATWIKDLVLAAAVELHRRDTAKPEPVSITSFEADTCTPNVKVDMISTDTPVTISKPELVADAEIRRELAVLSEAIEESGGDIRCPISVDSVRRWHDTLQAVAGDLVVARESLEQCKAALPEHMRASGVMHGIVALKGALSKTCDQRDEARANLDRVIARNAELLAGNERLGKERDEARGKLEGIRKLTESSQ